MALTHDPGVLADAADRFAAATELSAAVTAGGCARKQLRRAREAKRARGLAGAGPWGAAAG